MDNTKGLNDQQKQAVLHKDGALLIIAGAGAGKTKTLTHRIVNLIESGVEPSKILAITFTNKAAKEMRDRVSTLIKKSGVVHGEESFYNKPFVSTFHSLGVHILREKGKHIGVPKHFTILDQTETLATIKEAIKSQNLDPKQYEPRKIHYIISKQKNDLVSLENFAENAGNNFFHKIVVSVWQKYEALLAERKGLDFDDLIQKPVHLLQNEKEIQKYYQNKWTHLHIDEYQDTNTAQYELSQLLVSTEKNICVVGDVDQNIYGWRGADIKNLLNFEKDYPATTTVLLEQNYRSTQNILGAANQIIKKNELRVEKNLFTKKGEGEKISFFDAFNEGDEARFIARESLNLIKEGVSPSDIAVLYRANFQSRSLEEAFLTIGTPYQVLGVKFFDRKEIKDILSYLKASLNPDSLYDIKRSINIPTRGIGKVTLAKIFAGTESELSPKMQEKVSNFRKILTDIKRESESKKTSELIKFILKHSGIEKMLLGGGEEELERLENIRELVTLATKYDIYPPDEGLEKLLADAALATDQDSLEKPNEAVKLMTVHASKGLEFSYVFITGLEQDLFPHSNIDGSKKSKAELEEERRLFYVAITRAKEKLYLSFSAVRTIFGSQKINTPSEFLSDIGKEFLEPVREEGCDLEDTSDGSSGKTVYLEL